MAGKLLSPRIILLIIVAVFAVPLAVAWLMFSGALDLVPASTRNHGALVEPPLPISWEEVNLIPGESPGNSVPMASREDLAGHWVILHPLPDDCDEVCLQRITSFRQIQRAAGRNQDRIRIALLTPAPVSIERRDTLRAIYREFRLIGDASIEFMTALKMASAHTGKNAGKAADIYLIDPLGNIMMVYSAEVDPNDLSKDLKQLLKWSRLDS